MEEYRKRKKTTEGQSNQATKRTSEQATKRPKDNKLSTHMIDAETPASRDQMCISEDARQTFNKFDSNFISIHIMKSMMPEKLSGLYIIQDEILGTVEQSDEYFQECFFNLLIVEYKEYLYKDLFESSLNFMQHDIMQQYKEFLNSSEKLQNILLNHQHDPDHLLFCNTKSEYMFYEIVESRGYSILELSQSEDALHNFESDIICDYCDEFVL